MSLEKEPDKGGTLREVITSFLKIGLLAYGGPAIMGVMQNELQEKRQWVIKGQFLEGLSLVNMLPGPGATQLGIFLGYSRKGWWGGMVAGLSFVLPAFFIMSALTITYTLVGTTTIMRSALYGLGPVVLGIFIVAAYRLGRNAITSLSQIIIAVAAGLTVAISPVGIAMALLTAGGLGILIFHSKKIGVYVLTFLTAAFIVYYYGFADGIEASRVNENSTADLTDLGLFFLKVGTLTFGGGLSVIAFIQDQVVNHYHWLTHREFIDGLALGQFTPGPILMIAAFVGYKIAGITGAAVCAFAIFLPSFILMLTLLPVFNQIRHLQWMKAAMKGAGPATIGVLTVSLFQLAPHAVPDYFAASILIVSILSMLFWRVASFKLILGGAILGILSNRFISLIRG